ncbi:MAG: hypothetical protein ABIJ16_10035 [Bacteroidota bacterium]
MNLLSKTKKTIVNGQLRFYSAVCNLAPRNKKARLMKLKAGAALIAMTAVFSSCANTSVPEEEVISCYAAQIDTSFFNEADTVAADINNTGTAPTDSAKDMIMCYKHVNNTDDSLIY